jgi:hypothetical protein
VLIIVNEQEEIIRRLVQSNPTRLVSVTDSELELELAQLVYGHPEKDYCESSIDVSDVKTSDIQNKNMSE